MSLSLISPQPYAHKTDSSTRKPTSTQRFVRKMLLSLSFMLNIDFFPLVLSAQLKLLNYFYFLVQVCGIRAPDAVWHHSAGRKKFTYFLDQPTSVTGAGRLIFFYSALLPIKTIYSISNLEYCPFYELLCCVNRDISFLCDALAAQRQRISLPPMAVRATTSIKDSQKASQAQGKILGITGLLVLRLTV